jgi:hypothetical protein
VSRTLPTELHVILPDKRLTYETSTSIIIMPMITICASPDECMSLQASGHAHRDAHAQSPNQPGCGNSLCVVSCFAVLSCHSTGMFCCLEAVLGCILAGTHQE